MRRLVGLPLAVAAVMLIPDARTTPTAASLITPLLKSTEPTPVCLMPRAEYQEGTAGTTRAVTTPIPPDWPGSRVIGGNIPPTRQIIDPHPTFNGMAIDPENGIVALSDENRGSLLTYAVSAGSQAKQTTEYRTRIIGSRVGLNYIAGVTLDPSRREVYTTNNDGGGLVVFPYDADGDTRPARKLTVPHQSWGLSLDLDRDELAVTSQQYQGISIYKRTASRTERPSRTIRGDKTQMADPHGVFLDGAGDEVFTANHGNWTEMRTYSADGPPLLVGEYIPGRFEKPSIRVYPASANGNVAPIRTIQGEHTRLAWPMGITVDREAGELFVTNYSTNEILVYRKTATGDVAPIRIVGGDKTGIVGPIAVQVDRKRNELWVANYGDHTAVVFDRGAGGNVAPKRIIRNAPAGTPTTGFTNASAAAYDSKRDQILVPN